VRRFALPFGKWLAPRSELRLRRAHRVRDEILFGWIDERVKLGEGAPDDALTAIVADVAGAGAGTNERRERRRAARDKLFILLLGGVKTTPIALISLWNFLARSPESERRLHEELETVLGGRQPGADDLPRLPFLSQVVQETLRLHPPATALSRTSPNPIDLESAPARIPAHCSVGVSPWLIQRDERFFPRPLDFTPERWDGGTESASQRAYFPFGLGARRCIGEQFALLEVKLMVAAIAQRVRLVPAPGARLRLEVSTTLRATRPLPMRVEPRSR
jgi:cytochrome P450